MNTEKLNKVIPDDAIIEARWGSDVNYRSGGLVQLGTAGELRAKLPPSRLHNSDSNPIFGDPLCKYAGTIPNGVYLESQFVAMLDGDGLLPGDEARDDWMRDERILNLP